MYTTSRIGGLLLALSLAILAVPDSSPAAAQDAIPLKIGILDAQVIKRDSKAAKAMQAELKKKDAAYKAELVQKEKALLQAAQKLAADRKSLSAEEFEKRRQELNAQEDQYRKDALARQRQFQALEANGNAQITKALIEVVAEIAKAKGITLVMYKSEVLLTASAYEITAETLKKLDAKLPTVKLVQQ